MKCPKCGTKISLYGPVKKWRENHREEYNKIMRDYREKNKDKINAARRKARAKS